MSFFITDARLYLCAVFNNPANAMKPDSYSVENFTINNGSLIAAFVPSTKHVWKEDSEGIRPIRLKGYEYMPWGVDNKMPYNILDQIEQDETINTCQQHNIKNCYAAGLEYLIPEGTKGKIADEVRLFCTRTDLSSYYLGVCTDMKFWQFAVTVFTLNKGGDKIAAISRKEAMYCRFSPDTCSRRYVFYANFRDTNHPDKFQKYILLDQDDPLGDLEEYMKRKSGDKQFAMVTRIPTPDNTYYPIPYYASLFKGKWYDIKQLIALAKYSKLKNAAPLKYLITIAPQFWEEQFDLAGITAPDAQADFVAKKKSEIVDFLTSAENSGRAVFTGSYVDPGTGKTIPHIQITNLEQSKEGGDWQTDIQEAINMVCFTMGVHSNLVGSVPGKSQSNNSGSDKRELYMIAQLLNKPTHDLLLRPHRVVCAINKWLDVEPICQIMQLTTLDEHRDIKQTDDTGKSIE